MKSKAKFKVGDLVKVEQFREGEAEWAASKGGNPYGVQKIRKIFKNDGTYESLPQEEIAVLEEVKTRIGGWHVPISRLEHAH